MFIKIVSSDQAVHCNHYPSLPVRIHFKTFRQFRVFVFWYKAITENAELAENKIGVIFDWKNPWKGIRVSWEIILRLFDQLRNITIIFRGFYRSREFRGMDLAFENCFPNIFLTTHTFDFDCRLFNFFPFYFIIKILFAHNTKIIEM